MDKNIYYSLATVERTAKIVIFGDITSFPLIESDVSSYNLYQQIDNLDVDKIEVHINSYGGEVSEALAITNSLLRHRAEVETYVDGFACSAASIIFMAGDRRVMSPLSNFLVHPAWAFVQGNANDLRKEAASLDAITEQSVTMYMSRIVKSRDQLLELMNEERFMTPQEALEWGFATEIDPELLPSTPTQSVLALIHERLGQKREQIIRLEDAKAIFKELLTEQAEEHHAAPEEPKEAEPAKPNLMSNFIKAFERKE